VGIDIMRIKMELLTDAGGRVTNVVFVTTRPENLNILLELRVVIF